MPHWITAIYFAGSASRYVYGYTHILYHTCAYVCVEVHSNTCDKVVYIHMHIRARPRISV